MIRVGVVSDIHANLAAFFTVLMEFQSNNIDLLINLGDVVGYYSKPNEVLGLLAEYKEKGMYEAVMGNHDISVCGFIYHEKFSSNFVASIGESFLKSTNYNAQESWSWTISVLDDKLSRILLDETSKTIDIGGLRFHLVHGAPYAMRGRLEDEVGYYLTPRQILKNKAALENYFTEDSIDVLLTGHTHICHKTQIGNTMLMNPGSVGQPRDGDDRTSFLILEIKDQEIKNVQLHRKPYMVSDRIPARFATSAEDNLLSGFNLQDF